MPVAPTPAAPPHCPNPSCAFHTRSEGWCWVRDGYFHRHCAPRRVQRFRCRHCRRRFSEQTFRTTYWLQRPHLLRPIFHALLACSGFRQIARSLETSPHTVLTHAARLGRHCLLLHQQLRPKTLPAEPLVLDGFLSFEWSQYYPTLYHVAAGQHSHFFHGFTESELRRSGRMTARQRRKRARLEATLGRPDPRSTEKQVAALLATLAPEPGPLELHSDEHADYPRALRRVPHLQVSHRTVSSRAVRTPRNPLFAINLLDMLVRHSGANHKRETIAFSKRRASAIDRLWIFAAWRNYMKPFSERARGDTPAMRLGLLARPLAARELLADRRFPGRIALPPCWMPHYQRAVPTRALLRSAVHDLRYAA